MKSAKLHNGLEISFADGVSDKAIDETVKKIVENEKREKSKELELIPLIIDLFNRINTAILNLPKPQAPKDINLKELERGLALMAAHAKESRVSIGELYQEIKMLRKDLNAGISALSQDNISSHAEDIKKLISKSRIDLIPITNILVNEIKTSFSKQSSSLQKTIKSSGEMAINEMESCFDSLQKTLAAPKEIIRDKNGKPIGVRIKN